MQTPIPTRVLLLLLLSYSLFLQAQSHVTNITPSGKPMTVQDVIKLSKAGFSDDLIISQIEKNISSLI